jgi:hypothetical protein
MRKTFVMRGRTASTAGQDEEVLNFGKYKQGYAYRLTEFSIYPGTGLHTADMEISATLTASKNSMDPNDVNFNDEGLIGSVLLNGTTAPRYPIGPMVSVINDTYIITQNLILRVSDLGGSATPVNWQCRFESVKMTGAEEAAVNYKQFAISDE